jgi:hypothetical protein
MDSSPFQRLQKDFAALRHAAGRAHKWQAEINAELRERLGEVEATIAELIELWNNSSPSEFAKEASKGTRSTSQTASITP